MSCKDGAIHREGKRVTLTQEEIARMLGTSRETVTRPFADSKKKQFLQVKGSALIIKDRAGLETVVTFPGSNFPWKLSTLCPLALVRASC